MAGNGKVTRNDVAKLAGVSPAVVSYVLNKSKYVSEERTKAVLDAVKELNYIPNFNARNLKTNRSMQIAFVCDNLRNDWLELAEAQLFKKGYYVSHCYTKESEDFIQMLIARQFDAVLMMSNVFEAEQLNEIADLGVPVALYQTKSYEGLHDNIVAVVPDYKNGIEKAVNYLTMRGHKRIGMLPPLRFHAAKERNFRYQAFTEALAKNDLEFCEKFVCEAAEDIEELKRWAMELLLNPNPEKRPSAFLCSNDYNAMNMVTVCRQLGLRVPEDVALIGSDNLFLAEICTPPITTIDFSKELFAEELANTLLNLIDGKEETDKFLPMNLIIREST